jgi:zinc transporter 9
MNNIATLIVQSLGLFLFSFFIGNIPLFFDIPEYRIKYISTFGAGLLLGTAFIIIIPEGFSSYSAEHEHSIMGICLSVGFGIMFVVDQVSNALIGHGEDHHHHHHFGSTPSLIGLIIHCIADGVAMGVASASDKSNLEFLVFLSILLHKAPSAFALTSLLMSNNSLSHNDIRKKVGLYCISAPLSSLLAFFFISSMSYLSSSPESKPSSQLVGILLLLSGGSFLFVSTVHILPEVLAQSKSANDSFKISAFLITGLFAPLFFMSSDHH